MSSSGEGKPVVESSVSSPVLRLTGFRDPSGFVSDDSGGDGVARIVIGPEDGVRGTIDKSIFRS
jgi:hypothetical protein